MDRVTEAFSWPFRDPAWVSKLLIIALTLLIPIVGSINGLGWMLASLDRLRAGEELLAPANLSYIGRGFRLFAVELIYSLAIVVVALLIFVPAVALSVRQGQGSANSGLIAAAVLLNLIGFSVITLLSLALTFTIPAIVLATDRAGVGAGIDARAVVRRSRANLNHTLIAGLMLIAASFVGSIGSIACGVGILVTLAYSLAMQAWIIRSFETG
ncbi:MAG TPA: DUF4013 domain-containing protein [Candidatus Micrarchaeaceae archaeon]|nr:DUF4013 domain-containing protein [Candidatus Micrarchaeaceae archaeon]